MFIICELCLLHLLVWRRISKRTDSDTSDKLDDNKAVKSGVAQFHEIMGTITTNIVQEISKLV